MTNEIHALYKRNEQNLNYESNGFVLLVCALVLMFFSLIYNNAILSLVILGVLISSVYFYLISLINIVN